MNILGFEIKRNRRITKPLITKPKEKKKTIINVPKNQVSKTQVSGNDILSDTKKQTEFIDLEYIRELIPQIRTLAKINPDIKLAMKDKRELANTGHKIYFDKDVPLSQQKAMRDHLKQASKGWSQFNAGIQGIINKTINQGSISGALSVEAVVNSDFSGIKKIVFVNPEEIIFRFNRTNQDFHPYQIIKQRFGDNIDKRYVKLNLNTYKYLSLSGDTELPYGDPEFMAAINNINSQKKMSDNIDFIISQLGLMGFFEALIEKPDRQANENDDNYTKRLTDLLTSMKSNLNDSMKEGITVGYKEDHEFNFHSTTKDIRGVSDIFNLNENQIANGIGHPASFLGVPSSETETQIAILFSKVLSQLRNLQIHIAYLLEFWYELELRLAGFKFKHLNVKFEKSTVTDELKFQQSQEYKIRNLRVLYADGIINQEEYADEMGYEAPDKKEPRVPIDPNGDLKDAQDKRDRKKDQGASDKSTRDKRKDQPRDNKKSQ